jgi:hypothetical protein
MNTTTIHVELLIIGMGTTAWIAFIVAGILRKQFAITDTNTRILPLVALAYVLGIVTDRPVRNIYIPLLEVRAQEIVFTAQKSQRIMSVAPFIDRRNLPMELEKYIRNHSAPLAAKVDYNRSRLRICRAWVIHFFLLGPAFFFWNSRLHFVSTRSAFAFIVLTIAMSAMTLWTTWLLCKDHQRDIAESFEVVYDEHKTMPHMTSETGSKK